MDIEVITDTEAFGALREEWNELLSRSSTRHIFLTHEWQYTWWRHFGTGDANLLILLVRDQKRLVGIAPLRRGRMTIGGLPVLRQISFLIGYEADYRDFLLEQGREWDVLEAILGYLKTDIPGWQIVALRGIHGGSPTNELLPVIAQLQGLEWYGELGVGCPYVPLPASYEEFAASMSGGVRREYGRKLRAIEKQEGEISLAVKQGEQLTEGDFDGFLRLHQLSWQGRGGTKALRSDGVVRFHRDLLGALSATRAPTIAQLAVNGKVGAVIYGYVDDGVLYDYLPGHDPVFQRYSLGIQVILKAVEYGIAQGWRELDLMRGEESYKFTFTRNARRVHNHLVARSGMALRAVRTMEAIRG